MVFMEATWGPKVPLLQRDTVQNKLSNIYLETKTIQTITCPACSVSCYNRALLWCSFIITWNLRGAELHCCIITSLPHPHEGPWNGGAQTLVACFPHICTPTLGLPSTCLFSGFLWKNSEDRKSLTWILYVCIPHHLCSVLGRNSKDINAKMLCISF